MHLLCSQFPKLSLFIIGQGEDLFGSGPHPINKFVVIKAFVLCRGEA